MDNVFSLTTQEKEIIGDKFFKNLQILNEKLPQKENETFLKSLKSLYEFMSRLNTKELKHPNLEVVMYCMIESFQRGMLFNSSVNLNEELETIINEVVTRLVVILCNYDISNLSIPNSINPVTFLSNIHHYARFILQRRDFRLPL